MKFQISTLPSPFCCEGRPSLTVRLYRWLIPGAMGIFAARVLAEAWGAPLPLVGVLALAATCVAALLVLSCRISFNLEQWWPALLLLAYAVWPARDLKMATAVILLASLTTLLLSTLHSPLSTFRPGFIIFVISLAAYGLTLQKDVLPADSGEFQLIAATLGVAHPPGFPLYTMVGKLFTLLTPWRPALGLNLMSAVLAALALTLIFATVQRIVGGTAGSWGGLAAALALGTSTTFWAQATTANIRMPTVFFVAWCLYEITNSNPPLSTLHSPLSTLTRLALALSLGIAHHPSLVFVGLFFILYLVLADPSLLFAPRRWPGPLAAFALGQLVWLYLPIRGAMGAPLAPDNLATLQGFLYHVLARGFEGDMFAFAGPEYLPARAALVPMLMLFQFNAALLVAAALGALITAWRDWRLAILLIGGWALHVFVTITYRAPQTVEYMLPAYVLQIVALGIGTGQLCLWSQRHRPITTDHRPLTADHQLPITPSPPHLVTLSPCHPVTLSSCFLTTLAAATLLAGLLNGAARAPGYIQLAGDHSTRDYVAPILQQAPPGAIVLADWHWATPMQYLQVVEGLRPDVKVDYVYPLSNIDYALRWLQRIEKEIARRPVIVTRYAGIEYSAAPFIFQPLGPAFLVLNRPPRDLPLDFAATQLNFQDDESQSMVNIIGYRVDRSTFQAGQVVELALAWQAAAPLERPYSLTVHVLDANGRHVAQRDVALMGKGNAPGEVYSEQFKLPLAIDLLPGQYQIVVGVYYTRPEGGWQNLSANGQTLGTLAHISLAASNAPFTRHPLDVPFENGVRLVGADYDRSDPNTLRVYLHWQGPTTPLCFATRASDNQQPTPVVHLQTGDAISEQALPILPGGAYAATVHDLDAANANGQASITVLTNNTPIKSAGVWGVAQTSIALPSASPGSRYILLGDQLVLTHVSAFPSPILGDEGKSLHPGDELRLNLTFFARRSLVNDYSMSIRLVNRDGAWWLPQDTKPALDTIRTLKWIAGSCVLDSHRFTLPADAAPGWADAHLTVYDEFRQAILPPLDTRMGDSVLLGSWEVAP